MASFTSDYFTMPDNKPMIQRTNWEPDWTNPVSPWETITPNDMPVWQYTANALQNGEPQMYYPHGSPISPYTDPRSNAPSSVMSSPATVFNNDGRFAAATPAYNTSKRHHNSNRSTPQATYLHVPEFQEGAIVGDIMEDDDSECAWDSNQSRNVPLSNSNKRKSSHIRSHSANEANMKNAKRAHTVVERNYRERLNDKIADLALYLFETSSDSRTKPSKSLVMTRAKERLKQLESRNKNLEAEVVKLRQHIAILDHIVTSQKAGEPSPPQS